MECYSSGVRTVWAWNVIVAVLGQYVWNVIVVVLGQCGHGMLR